MDKSVGCLKEDEVVRWFVLLMLCSPGPGMRRPILHMCEDAWEMAVRSLLSLNDVGITEETPQRAVAVNQEPVD
jgi:hypothetical protein